MEDIVSYFKHRPELEKVYRKMFEVVGEEFSYEYLDRENWFLEHKWDLETMKKFKRWLVKELMTNPKLREEFGIPFNLTKKDAEKEAMWFIFVYGWNLKNNNEVDKK